MLSIIVRLLGGVGSKLRSWNIEVACIKNISHRMNSQARNQLGTPGGA